MSATRKLTPSQELDIRLNMLRVAFPYPSDKSRKANMQTRQAPERPELHKLGNGQTVIRYKGADKRGRVGVRNYKLGTVDDAEAARRLATFNREYDAMQDKLGKKNGHANKPAKAGRKIPRVADRATAGAEHQAPGPLVVIASEVRDHNAYNREHYQRRKNEAELGRTLADAMRELHEHIGIQAAQQEASARTLRMMQKRVADALEKIAEHRDEGGA